MIKGEESKVTSALYGNCHGIHEYRKINRIGEGTYGFVYRAIHKTTEKIVALKRIILHHENQEGFPLTSVREIKTLKRCNHPNIISLVDIVVGPKRDAVFLLFEYCEHDLSLIMKNIQNPFSESEIKCLILQLFLAVDYIHQNWIVHRDIKLSNLLYNSSGQLKLADFGLARTLTFPSNDDLTPLVVTLWYRSPELLFACQNYGFSVDIWSVGCVFAELLLNSGPLFNGMSEIDQLYAIFKVLGAPTARIWPSVINTPVVKNGSISLEKEKLRYPYNNLAEYFPRLSEEGLELLNRIFAYDPQLRITARAASCHEYFVTSPYPKTEEFMPTFASFHDQQR